MAQAANVTFIAGERKDTRNGKERYVLRTNDGREFSVWDATLYQAVMSHLHEELLVDMNSKPDDRGTWWNTLYGLPALGVQAQDTRQNSQAPAPAGGGGADMSALLPVLERIALALENMLQFTAERYMDKASADIGDDPTEPPDL